jgi:protein phosphatase-4 regulatory subunit 3
MNFIIVILSSTTYFAPVFEAFRANPVGDNLVSSAIVEMCDFIQNQNIKSLIEYIVTKHLVSPSNPGQKSLEDVATPYVSTLTTLRKVYEENLHSKNGSANKESCGSKETLSRVDLSNGGNDYHCFFGSSLIRNSPPGMSEKALEDQVSGSMLRTIKLIKLTSLIITHAL